ncbi:GPC5 protein, partial [Polyodon spathula]|nr:GPC5 protein [Polyodon spathula]
MFAKCFLHGSLTVHAKEQIAILHPFYAVTHDPLVNECNRLSNLRLTRRFPSSQRKPCLPGRRSANCLPPPRNSRSWSTIQTSDLQAIGCDMHSRQSAFHWMHHLVAPDAFQSLLHFAQNHTSSLFESAYRALAREATTLVKELFTDLSLYILGSDDTVEGAVQRFYDNLFPLVYNRLVNPGIGMMRQEYAECLRMTRQDVNPFGSHPRNLVQELSRSFKAGRTLSKALNMGVEVINATEHVAFTRECGRALVRMHYCPHCQGLTLIKPCLGYCLNVMRGCLPGLAELDQPWWDYISTLEELTNAMAGAHDLELALLGIRNQVNDAILYTQLNGPRLTATVSVSVSVCRTVLLSVYDT